MTRPADPDLPGDETFRPAPPVVELPVAIRCSRCPTVGVCPFCGGPRTALAMGMTISAESQAAIHHNRLRYGELAMARLGMANRYAETSYR